MQSYNFLKPSNKLEIKIADESHFCTIYYVENEEITVFLDTVAELPEVEIEVNIYAPDGIYNANSKIVSSNCLGEKVFYKLAFPTNIRHSQRREFLRADIETGFYIKVENDYVDKTEANAVTKNLCAKGLCFVSDTLITNYKKIYIELILKERIIKTHAELVYSSPLRVDNAFKFLTALSFTDISKDDMDFIAGECREFVAAN